MSSAPSVVVPGEAFRNKIRLAICYWAKHWPHEVAAYKRECKQHRERLRDHKGYSESRDLASYFKYPPRVPELLGMSEFSSKFMYGVPFGCGNPRWMFDKQLDSIFMSEVEDGFMSTLRGGTALDDHSN